MKKLSFLLLTVGFVFTGYSQVKLADISPRTTVKQQIGLTNFELEYARPSVRDRKIMGDVVPFGEIWRTGANKNSMLTFDTDIMFGGQEVKAGTYSIYTMVNKDRWDVILYIELESWGVPRDWSEENIVAKVNVKATTDASFQETFTIAFDHITAESCLLVFAWETTKVAVPIAAPSKEVTLASIEKTMAGPSDRDYYAAASFYLDEKMELEKALEYIKKAVAMRGEEAFWYTRKEALIQYELGNKKAAIEAAKRSLESAKKANYDSYINMNEESIKAWSKK